MQVAAVQQPSYWPHGADQTTAFDGHTTRPALIVWLTSDFFCCPQLRSSADQTEAFNGHTIPQFPEKGEDVNLAGVSSQPGQAFWWEQQYPSIAQQPLPWPPLKLRWLEKSGCPIFTQVWELTNLAYAEHEIISDYVTPAFMWFEGG